MSDAGDILSPAQKPRRSEKVVDDNPTKADPTPVPEPPMPECYSLIKKAINTILWEHGRKDVSLGRADEVACRAFDIIWPLCCRDNDPL